MWFPVYGEKMGEKKKVLNLEEHKKAWYQNMSKSKCIFYVKVLLCFFICRLTKCDSINAGIWYDLEGIDTKLGNKMMLHVPKLNTFIIYDLISQSYGSF